MVKNLNIKNLFGKKRNEKGVTLFIAVVVSSLLLFISFFIVNLTIKNTMLSGLSRESQIAFYAADAGLECALYWDTVVNISRFSTGPTFIVANVSEFSGIMTSDALDQTSTKESATTGNFDSGFKNTEADNELIYGYASSHGDITNGTNFILGSSSTRQAQVYRVVTTSGSYAAQFRLISGNHYVFGSMATFKTASAQTPALVRSQNYSQSNNWVGINPQITLTSPSGNGNLLVVAMTYDLNQQVVSGVTDSKNNVYERAFGTTWESSNGQYWTTEVWYADGIIGGGSPIVITPISEHFFPKQIQCNNQSITYGSQTIPGSGGQVSIIGGGGVDYPTSIFYLDFSGQNSSNSCVVVEVTKGSGDSTEIRSKGYNTCNTSNPRRVERGVEVTY